MLESLIQHVESTLQWKTNVFKENRGIDYSRLNFVWEKRQLYYIQFN